MSFFEELRFVVGKNNTIGDHTHTIYHQFSSMNLEDDSAPAANELIDCEFLEASSQRLEVPMLFTSKIAAKTGHTSRPDGKNVAMENLGDKLGE